VRSNPTVFRLPTLAVLGGVLLLVAACTSAGASSAPSVAAPSSAGGGGALTVAAASGTVGAYLTGANGMTLYEFTADSMNTTACTAACATKWPPLTVASAGAVTAGTGVSGTLATFARPDGTLQVTINGMPIYYFSGDTKAGDTTGQGFGGKWFVAAPSGAAPAGSVAPAGSAAPSSSGGRYSGY
jgi:predicted lipoprotein with Yx(FWY)xxD motif